MTLDEILQDVRIQAKTFIKPQSKALFKKIIEPYFEEVSAFKKNLNPYILELKKEIDKYLKKNTKSKFLDMYNRPGKDYIRCSNSVSAPDTPYFDVYYPVAEYEEVWGWIPQKAYKNDPLKRLLSYANWPGPEEQNLTMFQFAIVAILYDAPRLKNGCNLIYYGSGDDLADRASLEFMKVLIEDENRKVKTPFGRVQSKRVIDRLKNAFDTVKIKLGDKAELLDSGKAGNDEQATPETDLAKLLTETEQNSTPAKRWKIWTCLKKIPRWICGIVVAVFIAVVAAIVVDIFADFGWIERIKALIYKILQPK